MERRAAPPQFSLVDDPLPQGRGVRVVLGAPRTLSVQPFAFPFSQPGKVREALRLRLLPLLGEGLAQTLVVPLVTERRGKGCSGVAWIARRDELESLSARVGEARFWPAPLALLGEEPDGVLGVVEDDGVAALFVAGGIPRGYRWQRLSGQSPEDLRENLLAQGDALGCPGPCRVVDLRDPSQRERFLQEAPRGYGALPFLGDFDLSLRGAAHAESRSRSLHTLRRLSWILGLGGGLFCLAAGYQWLDGFRTQETATQAQYRVFRGAFGEESPGDPLMEAKRRLRRAGASTSGLSFGDLLALMGQAFKDQGQGVRLESLRYGPDKSEIQGSASTTEAVQAFRKRVDDGPLSAAMGDLQQIPGGGFRFVLTLKEDRP